MSIEGAPVQAKMKVADVSLVKQLVLPQTGRYHNQYGYYMGEEPKNLSLDDGTQASDWLPEPEFVSKFNEIPGIKCFPTVINAEPIEKKTFGYFFSSSTMSGRKKLNDWRVVWRVDIDRGVGLSDGHPNIDYFRNALSALVYTWRRPSRSRALEYRVFNYDSIIVFVFHGMAFPVLIDSSLYQKSLFGFEIVKHDDGPAWKWGDGIYPITCWREMMDHSCTIAKDGTHLSDGSTVPFRYDSVSLKEFKRTTSFGSKNMNAFIMAAVDMGWTPVDDVSLCPPSRSGITKLMGVLKPLEGELRRIAPVQYSTLRKLVEECRRSVNGVKISRLLNESFKDVKSAKEVMDVLTIDWKKAEKTWRWYDDFKAVAELFPVYRDLRKSAINKNGKQAYKRLMAEAETIIGCEGIGPLLTDVVQSGDIPVSTFFRTKSDMEERYFLYNDNWSLWEWMLEHHRETTIKLAKEVSIRSTYEKDLMAFFYFLKEELPAYLRKHTGRSWTCVPRLVDSANELNPPSETAGGVTKRRSALTPTVEDQAGGIVSVPYASLCIPGRMTQYCYTLDYQIVCPGFKHHGSVALRDIEIGLNGRDDYGLMYYTLTGTSTARGYPTFLIIFERLEKYGKGTRVHFHRVHPFRSKQGDYAGVHNWTRNCYNWMVGNVKRELIAYQQGDLCFTREWGGHECVDEVDSYDKHTFECPVLFAPPMKSAENNILGYFKVEKHTMLHHPEHACITVDPGEYTLRQCRSWEANPKGIWSLRID